MPADDFATFTETLPDLPIHRIRYWSNVIFPHLPAVSSIVSLLMEQTWILAGYNIGTSIIYFSPK